MYRSLRAAYERTPETFLADDGRQVHWWRVRWIELGYVTGMTEAKAKYGGSPVLEQIA